MNTNCNATVKPAIRSSKFCKMRSWGVIEFSPYGAQGEIYEINLEKVGTRQQLDEYIRKFVKNAVDSSKKLPPGPVDDLISFRDYVCNPAQKERMEWDFKRAEGIGLYHGKLCRELPDGSVELRIDGKIQHKFLPGSFCGHDGLVNALLDVVREPWFTAEVKSELFDILLEHTWSSMVDWSLQQSAMHHRATAKDHTWSGESSTRPA